MTSTPEISIIMANFNGARFLADAIRSVQNQTLEAWELVIVDDASDDDSLAVATEAAATDARIRVLSQPVNRGPGAARNRGLDAARGRWVAIVDSDDAMVPGRLEQLLRHAKSRGAKIVADNQLICSSGLHPERAFLSDADLSALNKVGISAFIDSSRLYSQRPDLGFLKPFIEADVIRRGAVRYDEDIRVGEDFHFLLRLLSMGIKIELEPQPLYLYRKHAASVSHRLSQGAITALLAADERVLAGSLPKAARKALKRRMRGLHSWSAHERAAQAWKAGRVGSALATAARRPHAWPLMSRPILSRLGRLMSGIGRCLVAPGGRRASISSGSPSQ